MNRCKAGRCSTEEYGFHWELLVKVDVTPHHALLAHVQGSLFLCMPEATARPLVSPAAVKMLRNGCKQGHAVWQTGLPGSLAGGSLILLTCWSGEGSTDQPCTRGNGGAGSLGVQGCCCQRCNKHMLSTSCSTFTHCPQAEQSQCTAWLYCIAPFGGLQSTSANLCSAAAITCKYNTCFWSIMLKCSKAL